MPKVGSPVSTGS